MRLPRLTLLIGVIVVLIDAVSKAVVAHLLTPGHVIAVGPLLRLDLYYNHAGASNVLTGHPVLVSALSIVSTGVLVAMATKARSRGYQIGLGLLIGGGVGNLLDRLAGSPGPFRGGVIDWLRPLHSTGSMNLADLSINLGLVAIGLATLAGWVRGHSATARSAPVSGPGAL